MDVHEGILDLPGGFEPERPGRSGLPTPVLIALAAVLSAILALIGVRVLRHEASTLRDAETLVTRVSAQAGEQSALQQQVALQRRAGGTALARVAALDGELQQTLAAAESLDAGATGRVPETLGRYRSQALRATRDLQSGRYTSARRRLTQDVDPRLAELHGAVATTVAGLEASAHQADHSADLALLAILVFAIAGIGVIFWRTQRARHAAEIVALDELALRRREDRFRAVVQNSYDVVCLVNEETTIRYQSESAQRLLGFDPTELVGIKLIRLVHPEDVSRVTYYFRRAAGQPGVSPPIEFRMRHRDGSWLSVEAVTNNLLFHDAIKGFVLNLRDISDRRELERRLKHQAFHDALTNLGNRVLFEERVAQALTVRNRRAPLAVLFLDLDDFKMVNDSLGHAAGDQLLVTVAQRLQACLREEDTAARLGGDEFAVLIERTSSDDAALVAQRIIETLTPSFDLDGRPVTLNASIGIALSDSPRDTSEDLLRNADVAMYAAKAKGKGRFAFYDPTMHAEVLDRLNLKADLHRALERGELAVHYQPVVELETGAVVGAESLVRWRHPHRGLIGPEEFVPLAEGDVGLILPLGRWVLRETCRQAHAWMEELGGSRPFWVSVNLSTRQVQQPDLVDEIAGALSESGLAPENLMLEVTESVFLQDAAAVVERLNEVKDLGVRIAIDDFGTGYSSLAYLQVLPIDVLKIAKPFIDGVAHGESAARLAHAIIELGRALDLDLVAEGIEQSDQLHALRSLGCAFGQGFLFSEALPAMGLGPALAKIEAGPQRPTVAAA
ncbi:MAG: hypothetical protein QOK31_1410 [Solirubrobacteraceae bacterium]|nr:hypothetical protein [Solirubrobacteraceae bacterium]